MVAVTFGDARVSKVEAAKKPARTGLVAPRKSLLARIFEALMEARMEQARREIRLHAHFAPYAFDERRKRMVESETGNVPFGGY